MTYVIYGGYYNFDAIRANDQVFRNNFLIMIANNTNPTIQTFIELLLDAKADLTIVLKNDKGEKYSMHFVAEDLKNIMGNPDKDLNVFLQSMIANTKLNLPIKIEEGITLTDIFLENGYCIYVYTCDESILKIDLLQANDAALKTIMKRELYEKPDLVMKSICEMLRSTNNGLDDLASEQIDQIHARLDSVKQHIDTSITPKKVYYVVGFGEQGDFTAPQNSHIHEIITAAGGENIGKDLTSWSISREFLFEADPDMWQVSRK